MKKTDERKLITAGIIIAIAFVSIFAIGEYMGFSILDRMYNYKCTDAQICNDIQVVQSGAQGPFISGQQFTYTLTIENKGTQTRKLYVEAGMVPESWGGYSILFDLEDQGYRFLPLSSLINPLEPVPVAEMDIIQRRKCCPSNDFYDGIIIELKPGERKQYTLRPYAPKEGDYDACNNQGTAFVGYSDGSWGSSYVVGYNIIEYQEPFESFTCWTPTPPAARQVIGYFWVGDRTLFEPEADPTPDEIICNNHEDCTNKELSQCINPGTIYSRCVPCTFNAHCEQFGEEYYCIDGICVDRIPCTEDSNPICKNTTTYQYKRCVGGYYEKGYTYVDCSAVEECIGGQCVLAEDCEPGEFRDEKCPEGYSPNIIEDKWVCNEEGIWEDNKEGVICEFGEKEKDTEIARFLLLTIIISVVGFIVYKRWFEK